MKKINKSENIVNNSITLKSTIEKNNIKFAKVIKEENEVTLEIIEKPKLFKFGIS